VQEAKRERKPHNEETPARKGETHGTLPQLALITLSLNAPTLTHPSPSRSNPISSPVSRTLVAQSLASDASRLPPGKATWLVQRSLGRAARLMKRISGTPVRMVGCWRKAVRVEVVEGEGKGGKEGGWWG